MQKINRFAVIAVVIAAAEIVALAVNIWTNGQNASSVLGQTNFTTGIGGNGDSKLSGPRGIAVDPVSGKIFVADTFNNRVLRFTAANASAMGAAAEAVIGQPDFQTTTGATTQSKMNAPTGLSVDTNGRLWVAEANNHRITRWDNAANVGNGTALAAQVLGQPDFTSSTAGLSASSVGSVTGVYADSAGRLWAADFSNSRVLRYDDAAAKASGGAADAVLGQQDLTSDGRCAAVNANTLCTPTGVFLDAASALWVSDFGNNRVLRYNDAATKPNGGAADLVLGQIGFTTAQAGTMATSMFGPISVAVDGNNRLYVSDRSNARILIFNAAWGLRNGAAASSVLGQADFATAMKVTTQNGLQATFGIALSGAGPDVYVIDEGNNRVMRFSPSVTTGATVTVSGRVIDSTGSGRRSVKVTLTDSRGNVLAATTNSFGYYSFGAVQTGDTYIANAIARGLIFAPRVVSVTDSVVGLEIRP